jgi:hypothetical protein
MGEEIMIQINSKKITVVAQIATEILTQQTAEDLKDIVNHAGKMYAEGELAAEIAVKLMLRVLGIRTEGRGVSPVDALVSQAEERYRNQYAA